MSRWAMRRMAVTRRFSPVARNSRALWSGSLTLPCCAVRIARWRWNMKKWMKWTLGGIAALVVVVAVAGAVGWQMAQGKRTRTIALKAHAVPYATDTQS